MHSIIKLKILSFIIAISLPGIGYALVLLDMADPLKTSNITTSGLVSIWALMMLVPFIIPNNLPKHAKYTSVIIFWGVITTFFPIAWDLTWAMFNGLVNGATAEDKWLWYWWAYSVADTRFLKSDPLMIIVEYWSGILGFVQCYALVKFWNGDIQKAFRISLTAGCMQFYACTAFFGTEALMGFKNIEPDFFSFYMKFWGLNGFWIIMPIVTGFMFVKLLKMPDYDVSSTIRDYIWK